MPRETGALDGAGEVLRAGETTHAGRKVRVGLSAGEQLARERDQAVEPDAIERSQESRAVA